MQNTLLASLGRPLWRLLDAHNVDADALFKRVGLDPELINEPRTRYPYDLLCKAWSEAAVITGQEHVGLEVATHFTPLDLNALGVTFLTSATLTDALARLVRYESVLNSNLKFEIIESQERLDFTGRVANVPADAVKIIEDARIAVLVSIARMGLNNDMDPVEVAFTYPEPQSTGNHFGVFRCPLLFSQPVSRISFSQADSHRPFTDANRDLAVSNDRFLDELLRDLNSSDLVTRVKRAIIEELPSGSPAEEKIARQVFVSGRTLQRRLAEEDTSFRQLVLEARRELAEKYISDKNMPLAEISYMLGFSDASSFSRAFKSWTGDPPAVFRNNLP